MMIQWAVNEQSIFASNSIYVNLSADIDSETKDGKDTVLMSLDGKKYR
jgi:hypothetical protein